MLVLKGENTLGRPHPDHGDFGRDGPGCPTSLGRVDGPSPL
jgi:hypothetical protein